MDALPDFVAAQQAEYAAAAQPPPPPRRPADPRPVWERRPDLATLTAPGPVAAELTRSNA